MKYLLLFSVLMSATYCSDKFNDAIKFLKAGSYDAPFEVTFDGVTYYNETYEYGPEYMDEYSMYQKIDASIFLSEEPSCFSFRIDRVIPSDEGIELSVVIKLDRQPLPFTLNRRYELQDNTMFFHNGVSASKCPRYTNIDGWIEMTDCRHLEENIYEISGKFESIAIWEKTQYTDTVKIAGQFIDTRIESYHEILNYYL